jgi:hypothetical protein
MLWISQSGNYKDMRVSGGYSEMYNVVTDES